MLHMHFNLVKKKKSRSRSIKNHDEPHTAGNTVTQHDKNEVLLHNHMPPREESISKMWMGESPLLSFHIKDSGNGPLEKKNYCSIVPLCGHEPFITNVTSPAQQSQGRRCLRT